MLQCLYKAIPLLQADNPWDTGSHVPSKAPPVPAVRIKRWLYLPRTAQRKLEEFCIKLAASSAASTSRETRRESITSELSEKVRSAIDVQQPSSVEVMPDSGLFMPVTDPSDPTEVTHPKCKSGIRVVGARPPACFDVVHHMVIPYEEVADFARFQLRVRKSAGHSESTAKFAAAFIAGVSYAFGCVDKDGAMAVIDHPWDFFVPLDPAAVFGTYNAMAGEWYGGFGFGADAVIDADEKGYEPIVCVHVLLLPPQ